MKENRTNKHRVARRLYRLPGLHASEIAATVLVMMLAIPGVQARSPWSIYLQVGGAVTGPETSGNEEVLDYAILTSSLPSSPELQDYQVLSILEANQKPVNLAAQGELRLGAERLFLDSQSLGLQFGIAGGGGSYECRQDCAEATSLAKWRLLALDSTMQAVRNNPLVAYPFIDLLSPKLSYRYALLELGATWYFSPNAEWNPFVGLNLGAGLCELGDSSSDDSNCKVGRIAPRVGIRYSLGDNFYLQAQVEYQFQRVELGGEDFFPFGRDLSGPGLSFGLGYRL